MCVCRAQRLLAPARSSRVTAQAKAWDRDCEVHQDHHLLVTFPGTYSYLYINLCPCHGGELTGVQVLTLASGSQTSHQI